MTTNPDEDFVLKTVKSRDVHFVRFWFTDVLGTMKSFAVVPGELEDAFADGMGFDGSCIEGFCRTQESDMLAFPDASTFQVLPWRPEHNAVARMFCSIRTPDGQPFEGDPRHVLAQTVAKARERGYVFNVGPELEFYYFKDAEGTEVLDRGGYFDLTSLDYASDLRRDTVLTLEKMGIPVEYSHHENGPSQHEIDLRFTDALSMADAVMTYKLVVKEIALKHGVYASFMPKPRSDAPGSGMHVHQSLFDLEGNNAFFDPNDPQGYRLSKVAKHYIAGILKYAPEFCVITNQFVNSYKRLICGGEAPTYLSWASRNRSTLVRIPRYRPEREDACRIELRSPDPAANPYLAFAVMLAAGLKGIEDELELQPPTEDQDLFALSRQDLRRQGFHTLPESLGEAVELFATSDLMRETLGEHIHSYLVSAKRAEWNEYQGNVSSWERDRYLAVL
ncbi:MULTISPECIES: glutamine synthetase family protein [Gordonibacter]|uniref:Glutamine synthetase family protein n=1 Tax=Gordonibacter faecis TaxID=3047475 RepID=A0ABT7DNM0_9ACTN|nr:MULTISPECIES: glutamine synthetase family protein [unclassified Gordonibacter]MDJ1651135.1 glutamine synthetase family protein [Gordonibacter sp. KGMB12511]HIW76576.1 glutamine synthetase family protein [Candidatus Gordonibacter avicola]